MFMRTSIKKFCGTPTRLKQKKLYKKQTRNFNMSRMEKVRFSSLSPVVLDKDDASKRSMSLL